MQLVESTGFISCPASDDLGRRNFEPSIHIGIKLSELDGRYSPEDAATLQSMREPIRIWGLRHGKRNRTMWNRLRAGDMALSYMGGAFRYYAPVLYKWIDPSNTPLRVHKGKDNEVFALKFVVGELSECYLTIADYNDLLGYKPRYLPADPRVVRGDGAAAVLTAVLGRSIEADELELTLSPEGKRKYRRHLAVERRASNRRAILARRGYKCEACDFDFIAVYGDAIGNYAEVHHVRALSLEPLSDPKPEDFAVLCASCHRAVHQRSPTEPISIEDLKAAMNRL